MTAQRHYRERPAPAACGTIWRSSFIAGPSIIVPDGCMDLLWLDGTIWIAGADSQARLFAPQRGGSLVGLRFWPGVLPQLLRTRADQLADSTIALDAVTGAEARRWQDVLAAAEQPAAALVELAATTVAEFGLDRRPVRLAAELRSGMPIAQAAAEAGYSSRQLQRLAGQWYGYGAKHLQRVLRLRRADLLLAAGRTRAAAAAEAGYADASHLWRDQRALDEPKPDEPIEDQPVKDEPAKDEPAKDEVQPKAANRSTGLPSGSWITA